VARTAQGGRDAWQQTERREESYGRGADVEVVQTVACRGNSLTCESERTPQKHRAVERQAGMASRRSENRWTLGWGRDLHAQQGLGALRRVV
jgi:hypothetical protein